MSILFQVLPSLDKTEFQIKLHPEIFKLKELSLKRYFFKLSKKYFCFIDGTNVAVSKEENRLELKSL